MFFRYFNLPRQSQPAPVIGRRAAAVTLEHLGEVIRVRVADTRRDLAHRNIRLPQQLLRSLDAVSGQIFEEGAVVGRAEKREK